MSLSIAKRRKDSIQCHGETAMRVGRILPLGIRQSVRMPYVLRVTYW